MQADKARHAQRTSVEKALDAFATDLPQNPAAHHAFQQLRRQILDPLDQTLAPEPVSEIESEEETLA